MTVTNPIPSPGYVEDEENTGRIFVVDVPSSVAPARDRLTLVVLSGARQGALLPIDGDELVIGRGSGADARFDDNGLSRRHARFHRRDGAWYVEDLESTNGTWVDGQPLHGPRKLREGDRIQAGAAVLLKVTMHDAAEQEAARRLYDSAVRDPLTRVYNRRYLQERLASELAYSHRHETPLSVLLLDVDHFKRVNDTLGHLAGDAVLRIVGATLNRMVRAEDVVARWGGEEFVVLARGIDLRNATIFGERIRKLIEALSIPWESRPVRITISIGVATHSPEAPHRDSDSLVHAADRALYRAKHAGRNRVVSDVAV